MIKELVALAERIRQNEDQAFVHDSLCKERLDAFICIAPNGKFLDIISTEKKGTFVEDLVRTENKGRTSNVLPRLLLDNEKYVLGLPQNDRSTFCMKAYIAKLRTYENIPEVKEVINFYEKNKKIGLHQARKAFASRIQAKQLKSGTNFSFLIRRKGSKDRVVHSIPKLIGEIKNRYEKNEKKLKGATQDVCSICGKSAYRVRDLSTHGTIAGVLPRNSLGNYLISYEGEAFSSYGLEGNDNSLVCTHCAKAYVEAMNWLLAPRSWSPNKKGKLTPAFKNRKDISDDTQVVFWLQKKSEFPELDLLDKPGEEAIQSMFNSVFSGKSSRSRKIEADKFYAVTLTGVAARIAVRDWIETSLDKLHDNLVHWFQDIEVVRYDSDSKKIVKHHSPFKSLIWSLKSKNDNGVSHGRIGAALWRCAVMGTSPPLWLLSAVLNRIRANQGNVTSERVSLLKLYVNRTSNKKEGVKQMASQSEPKENIAYICGQLFSVLESIQYHAFGSSPNAGIRERFFSFASTMPATAFGRLMKLSQHHLTKIKNENYGLFVNLDKKLQELMCKVDSTRFPVTFSLEDQASFAIGYYYQQQKNFAPKSNK